MVFINIIILRSPVLTIRFTNIVNILFDYRPFTKLVVCVCDGKGVPRLCGGLVGEFGSAINIEITTIFYQLPLLPHICLTYSYNLSLTNNNSYDCCIKYYDVMARTAHIRNKENLNYSRRVNFDRKSNLTKSPRPRYNR